MTTFYIKKGRRYEPVAESEYWSSDAKPLGFHLVEVKPGMTSWKYKINPELAEVESALKICKDAMTKKMLSVNEMKPSETRYPEHLRPKLQKAFDAWKTEMGEDIPLYFEGASMNDIVEAGIQAIKDSYFKTEKPSE